VIGLIVLPGMGVASAATISCTGLMNGMNGTIEANVVVPSSQSCTIQDVLVTGM
jgi:hypothetical protein